MEKNEHNVIKKIIAPFQLLRVEKIYFIWMLSFFISFSSIILDIFNNNVSIDFQQGTFFGTCIAIIAPYFVDFIVDYLTSNRKGKRESYSTYKAWTLLACLVIILFLFFFYMSDCRTNTLLQIISTVIVAMISFYSYLVLKMNNHNILMKEYADILYTEAENREVEKLKNNAKNITTIMNENGDEVKL